MRLRPAAIITAASVIVAACGGDQRAAEEVARHYVASDDPAKCDDAALGFLERQTRQTGDAARATCRRNVERFAPPAGVRVISQRVRGDRARVELVAGGQDVTVTLERRDGDWLVVGLR